MFTGIITDIGEVVSIESADVDKTFGIKTSFDLSKIDIGASIACSGCCLTVVSKAENVFYVDVSAETLSKTNLGQWERGSKINLETSLRMGDELGGHIVSGHVDGLAKLETIMPDGDSYRLVITVPDEFKKFVAPKGSIAIEGISLTVNEVNDASFGINIIPHTWDNTTLSQKVPGSMLNFEIDMLARYVARMQDVAA